MKTQKEKFTFEIDVDKITPEVIETLKEWYNKGWFNYDVETFEEKLKKQKE